MNDRSLQLFPLDGRSIHEYNVSHPNTTSNVVSQQLNFNQHYHQQPIGQQYYPSMHNNGYYDNDDDKYVKYDINNRNYICGYVPTNVCYIISLTVVIGLIVFFILTVGFNNVDADGIDFGLDDNDFSYSAVDDDDDDLIIAKRVNDEVEEEEEVHVVEERRECPYGKDMYDGKCKRTFNYPNPVDTSIMNINETDPCDNFYMYACGKFINDERNANADTTFSYLYSQNMNSIYSIIDRAPLGSKLETFYSTCMSNEGQMVNFDGGIVGNLLNMVENNVNDVDDLAKVMGILWRYNILLPFEFSMELDPVNAKRALPTFIRSGLTSYMMEVGSELHKNEIKSRLGLVISDEAVLTTKTSYITFIEEQLANIWYQMDEIEDEFANLLVYSQEMKSVRRDLLSFHKFSDIMSPFDINTFIHYFINDFETLEEQEKYWYLDERQDIWVYKKEFFTVLSDLLNNVPIDYWKAYLTHNIIFSVVDLSPDVRPELYYTYHHGYDPEHSLPWKRPPRFVAYEDLSYDRGMRCAQITAAYLPIILDNYFINENEIDEDLREGVKSIAVDIKHELVEYLRSRGYVKTADKVDKIEIMAGAPNNWPIDHSDLNITSTNTHTENILNIRYYHQKLMVRTLVVNNTAKPFTPDDLFDSSLYLVNAYYQHQLNSIMINAGILLLPAYSPLYDDISKKARLGVFIGHEFTHSIDIMGNFFDYTGSYNPWSLDIKEQQYYNKADCFVNLYDKTTMLGNRHDGEMTINENIADIIGFRTAYDSVFKNNNQYTEDDKKQFFTVYAQTWCSSTTKEKEKEYISYSVHSTPEMRVNNVVTQHQDFYNVFQCKNRYKPCNIY